MKYHENVYFKGFLNLVIGSPIPGVNRVIGSPIPGVNRVIGSPIPGVNRVIGSPIPGVDVKARYSSSTWDNLIYLILLEFLPRPGFELGTSRPGV